MKKIFSTLICITTLLTPLLTCASNDPFVPSKDQVGLNVHWTLGGFNVDDTYEARLKQSKTRWVREHFYTEVLLSERPDAWFERYDDILNRYHRNGINVIGMLAYGKDHGDFYAPNLDTWRVFINSVVARYKNRVHVWEVWNEPDSPDYLMPNNPTAYGEILTTAYKAIKTQDPNATVLGGALSEPNKYFAEQMFQDYNDKFDALSVHAYYCREYLADGNLSRLENDFNELRSTVQQYRGNQKVWITEFGCSTGSSGITEEIQATYLKDATKLLIDSGFIERIFIYTIRNRDINNVYENEFGLMDIDLNTRPAWNWYLSIPIGPYSQKRLMVTIEARLASELKAKLNNYFPKGIPISDDNWPVVANAYAYGGYSWQEIASAIKNGGATVHPTIPQEYWKKTPTYKKVMAKEWVNGKPIFAYNQARLPLEDEATRAQELRQALNTNYNFASLKLQDKDWAYLVNGYIYGGYPKEAIARAILYGGKTVHESIPYQYWKNTTDYKNTIKLPIPDQK